MIRTLFAGVVRQFAPRGIVVAMTALVALGIGVVMAGRAEANAGPPYYADGKVAAEPAGLADIGIRRELLVIDMTGLPAALPSTLGKTSTPVSRNSIAVSVVYTLTNRGPARDVTLVFASGAPATAGFAATLNEAAIVAQPAGEMPLPAEWQPPATTPGLNSKDLLYLNAERDRLDTQPVEGWGHYGAPALRSTTSTYVFTATIPAGESVMAVRYRAEPQQYRSGGYTDYLKSYQFAYVLAPARAWDGYGGLDVIVRLPACWQAASRPELTRVGDELRGVFDSLPADALALTVAPCDAAKPRSPCGSAALVAPLAVGGVWLQRRRRVASAGRTDRITDIRPAR